MPRGIGRVAHLSVAVNLSLKMGIWEENHGSYDCFFS